ncbi:MULTISPECIES: hypothetical protein [Pandoraea]|uniref:ECF RNA polymerase sigma factor SigR n=2 Tax=Pandoraea TaxID=93217 RepID=A0A5E4TWY0_9BURK|nr:MULTISPECIES: hypothetical protein [Pandoraea]VVD64654.1 ECF RNA polymerase sigma factor SigR [Pandoraea soli]VVD92051.1 ECF RNA polymerase sigma factor SigR [Pandoraea cepalis]
MADAEKAGAPASERFDVLALPHLDATYTLARWLTEWRRRDGAAQIARLTRLPLEGTMRGGLDEQA